MSSNMKQTLIKGTLILTIAGALTKVLGFYNRIFLSHTIGAREIGIYQLIFPVYLIVHCICCVGFELGIAKFVAEESACHHRKTVLRYLKLCSFFSFLMSLLCMIFIFCFSDFIACELLKQKECSECLKIMTFAFPFISVKDMILSYFYAIKKTTLPAFCQLSEQIVRVASIWLLATAISWFAKNAALATIGLVLGEAASCLIACLSIPYIRRSFQQMQSVPETVPSYSRLLNKLFCYCVPITANRLLITALTSLEAILIPYSLTQILGNEDTALEIYGVLTGMALTFILFPSAITNSLAMMLLPAMSEAKIQKQQRLISRTASVSLNFCLLMGIFFTSVFLAFGKELGRTVFHNILAGEFLFILSWLCPFIYLSTTFTSILNGLGKTALTFSNNVIAVLIRIVSILFLIPIMGIQGYLIGLLASYACLSLLSLFYVHRETNLYFNARRSVLEPAFLCVFAITFSYISEFLLLHAGWSCNIFTLGVCIFIAAVIYGSGVYLLHLYE